MDIMRGNKVISVFIIEYAIDRYQARRQRD